MKTFRTTASLLVLFAAGFAIHDASAHGDRCDRPFQTSGTVTIDPGFSGTVGQFTIPSGFRLQIEQVSARIRLNSNTDRASFDIGTTVGGNFAWHSMPIQSGLSVFDRQISGPVTLYADSGSGVKIAFSRVSSNTQSASGSYAVTGCLFVP